MRFAYPAYKPHRRLGRAFMPHLGIQCRMRFAYPAYKLDPYAGEGAHAASGITISDLTCAAFAAIVLD